MHSKHVHTYMFIDFQILNAIESKTKHSDLKMIKGQIDRIARIRLGWKNAIQGY